MRPAEYRYISSAVVILICCVRSMNATSGSPELADKLNRLPRAGGLLMMAQGGYLPTSTPDWVCQLPASKFVPKPKMAPRKLGKQTVKSFVHLPSTHWFLSARISNSINLQWSKKPEHMFCKWRTRVQIQVVL